jgi:hypothetical protein
VDAQEHILREIFGSGSILHRPCNQGEHEILVAVDQLLKGPFVPDPAALDERALPGGGGRVHRPRY